MLMLVIELGGPFYNFLATPEFSVGKDGANLRKPCPSHRTGNEGGARIRERQYVWHVRGS